MNERVSFATKLPPETLERLRSLAVSEGRDIQSLIQEAIDDLIAARDAARPQADAMRVFEASHARYSSLYKRLAK